MDRIKELKDNSIYIEHNFLDDENFFDVKNKLENNIIKFYPTQQPKDSTQFTNRFQTQPCYQSEHLKFIDEKLDKIIFEKAKNILNVPILGYYSFFRKTLSSEIKKSKVNTRYGTIHQDKNELASILYFDKSLDGGTAFFENIYDKHPEMYVSAYPNRFVLYSGFRNHCPCIDFTYEERIVLVSFYVISQQYIDQFEGEINDR